VPTEKPSTVVSGHKSSDKKSTSSAKSLDDIMAESGDDSNNGGSSAKTGAHNSSSVKKAGGGTLNGSELGALKRKIENNWNKPIGSEGQSVKVEFQLDESGHVVGGARGIRFISGSHELLRSAQAAVMASAPFDELPSSKYEDWKDLTLNFDL
jgi:outer membrane biosynthesis protein TonB